LLRMRGKRQSYCAASNYFDEIAPLHCSPKVRDKHRIRSS
jgi:hypothetical protein